MSSDSEKTNLTSKNGKLIIVSGPSGVGKGTICQVIAKTTDAQLSISATTRSPGPNEVDGKNYYFMTRDNFEQKIKDNGFLEYAEVFGNYYGTPRDIVDNLLKEGKTIILEIDVQGALQVKQFNKNAVMIFILPPSQKELEKRLRSRNRDTDAQIETRLMNATNEIAKAWQHYQHLVVNDQLDHAVKEVVDIIDRY